MKNIRTNTATMSVNSWNRKAVLDEADIATIISHGYGITTDETAPVTDMDKSLFTVDELTGIVQAYALMRPWKAWTG